MLLFERTFPCRGETDNTIAYRATRKAKLSTTVNTIRVSTAFGGCDGVLSFRLFPTPDRPITLAA
jgi:hypothetical protein